MPNHRSNERPVLSIALVTGEEIESLGLPVLKVCATRENNYMILSGQNHLENALNESLQHLEEPNSTVLFLAVEVVPAAQRRRRVRGGDVA
ncbi:hypothetical protein H1P_6720004 [Hyella patelloides LEGE 07179]|uniref:Uncharacterized protein n=1 Tax=Hyella patelloides LEGE 07179 TaxID=945734 RepID=A0A563W393_9CYAN|nr:hypothetical protein [Hyella patelloides]VEP18013.1 hypothetical protein H1P_6720004 [Hyella patelloides LEGE 07179]